MSFPNKEQGEGLIRPYELLEHLIDDVYKAFEILEADKNSQYLRRIVVRNVFTFIEGVIQIIKHEIKSDIRLNHYGYELTSKEKEVLFEEKNSNGTKFRIFIPIDQNLKKTFNLAGKIWSETEYIFNAGDQKYKYFKRSKAIRNRLTHPRTYYDIEITNFEMECFARSFEWIRSEFQALFEKKVNRLNRDIQGIELITSHGKIS